MELTRTLVQPKAMKAVGKITTSMAKEVFIMLMVMFTRVSSRTMIAVVMGSCSIMMAAIMMGIGRKIWRMGMEL